MMFRQPGETFEAYLDRTLGAARSTLIGASQTYFAPVEQQILNHVVAEIDRKVRGEVMALARVRNRGLR